MKIIKPRYGYLLFAYLPILLISTYLAVFFIQTIDDIIPLIEALFLLLAFGLAISPVGKKKLNSGISTQNNKQQINRLIVLQISSGLVFWSISYGIAKHLPIISLIRTTPAETTIGLITQFWSFKNFLFPWPLYILFATAIAGVQKKSLKTALHPTLGKITDTIIGIGADAFTKQALFFSAATTIAILILQNFHLVYGLQPHNMLLGTLLFLLMTSALWRHATHILWYQGCTLRGFLLLTTVIITLIIILFVAIFNLLIPYLPASPLTTLSLSFIKPLQWPLYWKLFSFLWWLGWTPVISYFLLKTLNGFSIRAMIITGLIIPLIITLLSHYKILYFIDVFSIKFIGLLFSVISIFLISRFYQDCTITSLLASAGSSKNNRISLTVMRSQLMLIVMIIVAYLIGGINLITLILFSGAIPSIITMLAIGWGCLRCEV